MQCPYPSSAFSQLCAVQKSTPWNADLSLPSPRWLQQHTQGWRGAVPLCGCPVPHGQQEHVGECYVPECSRPGFPKINMFCCQEGCEMP